LPLKLQNGAKSKDFEYFNFEFFTVLERFQNFKTQISDFFKLKKWEGVEPKLSYHFLSWEMK